MSFALVHDKDPEDEADGNFGLCLFLKVILLSLFSPITETLLIYKT